MQKRLFVQILTGIVVVVFAVGILLTGGTIDSEWLRFYSVAVLIVLIALFLWERVFWHWDLIQRIDAVPRDLRGTWRGDLHSFWIDPSTGERIPVKIVYLVVRQSASSISITLLTDESRSVSTFAKIKEDRAGATLEYMYFNTPDSRVEDRSQMHHGSTIFDIIGRPATRLKGRYWTSRDSKGELEFTDHAGDTVDGFIEAEAMFKE